MAQSGAGPADMEPLTVAIMQPYFIPYAGYFRLFAATDLFVIYDCVQFPRRGWVHRNRLVDAAGREHWLTLPLAKAPREVRIRDLAFSHDAGPALDERIRQIPLLAAADRLEPDVVAALRTPSGTPVDYLEQLLRTIACRLGLRWQVTRSSALDVPESVRGQDRIVEIARRLGAGRYVNAPGGRTLYDPRRFDEAGIELRFLAPYGGPPSSILQRMLQEDHGALADDIRSSSQVSV
jgi:hypothetical protein